jgi:hypothetical protein
MRRSSVVVAGLLAIPGVTGGLEAQDTWVSATIGKLTFNNQSTRTCPAGKFVVGLQIRSGWYVHTIEVECAKLGPAGEHQSVENVGYIGESGTSGGQAHQSRCPSGKVIVGFKGRAGLWIDRIQVGCKSWKAGSGTEGTIQWLTAWGGTGGEPYGSLTCPAHMAIDYMRGDMFLNVLTLQAGLSSYVFVCKSP